VNEGVNASELIYLLGHSASLGDAREIAEEHAVCSGHGGQSLLTSRRVPSMQHDTISLFDEELSGLAAESVGRSGNENPRHRLPR
jgi:hypothetical protein